MTATPLPTDNRPLERHFGRKNSGGNLLWPATHSQAARSAVQEWRASRKSNGNLIHFRMCLAAVRIPDDIIDRIIKEELNATPSET